MNSEEATEWDGSSDDTGKFEVSQQLWHDKNPSLLKALSAEHRAKIYSPSRLHIRGLGFSSFIRRTASISRLLRHKGMWRIYSNPDIHGFRD
jgi:hypothetical protein